jgi:hypothetical protein
LAEKIMRKTHDGSSFGHAAFEARTLDDAELNAVTGGSLTLSYGEIKFEYTAQSPASAAPRRSTGSMAADAAAATDGASRTRDGERS